MFRSKQKQQLQAALEKLEAAQNRLGELEADWDAIKRFVALAAMSRDGIFESASGPFLDIFGYQQEQVIGKHHRLLCEADYSRGEDYIRFWRELVTGHEQSGVFLHLDANGQPVSLNSKYLPVVSEKGIVRRVIVFVSHPRAAVNDAPR